MTEQIVLRRRSRRRLQAAIATLLVVFGLILAFTLGGTRGGQTDAIYVPAPRRGALAAVEKAADRGDRTGCVVVRPLDDQSAAAPRVCAGDTFELEGHVYRLRVSRGSLGLELAGVRLDSGVIGAARGAARQLRLPGVAAEHAELLPSAECPEQRPCVRSLVGGTRTRLQPDGGAAVPLLPGDARTLEEGDVLWLGLSPLRVGHGSGGVALVLPEDYQGFRGARGWIHDPAPRWQLEGVGPWELRSERDLYRPGHLETRRIDRQLEEEIQQLVDQEILCLETGVPRTDQPPRVVWSSGQGCDPALVQPVTARAAALRTRYRHHPSLLVMIDRANDHLADGSYVARPEVLNFTFDWSFMVAPWAEDYRSVVAQDDDGVETSGAAVDAEALLVPVPVRLLGFWWGRTEHGVPADDLRGRAGREGAASVDGGPPFDLRVRQGTTSAQLRVEAPSGSIGALRHDDLLLLAGSSSPVEVAIDDRPGVLLGSICQADIGDSAAAGVWRRAPEEGPFPRLWRGPGQPDSRAVFGRVFPLGRLTWSPDKTDRIRLEELRAPAQDDCLHLARTADGGYAWSASPGTGQQAAPGDPGQGVPRAWQPIHPGSSLPLGAGALVLRDNGDLAATSVYDEAARGWRRIYPFEEDAGQLIGRGRRHYTGLEVALTPELKERVEDDLQLTIHGDLQRVVARALATAMETELLSWRKADRDVKNPGTRRGSAVLMDSDTGQVLAAATWPPFDPNLGATEEDAWRAELRARGTSFDPAENWAFVRNAAAGSTYKLATGIALGREGLLAGAGTPEVGSECSGKSPAYGTSGGLRVYRWVGPRVRPKREPLRTSKSSGSQHQCLGNHFVIPDGDDAVGPTFVEAFKESCNVWFSLATYRLMDRVIPLGRPRPATLVLGDDDLGLGDGPRLFSVDGRLGLLWPRSRPIENVIAPRGSGGVPRNRHGDALLELGHRYLYKTSGGLVTQQGSAEWAPGYPYPTATPERAWMAGVRPGLGFRYPEVPGPASYGGDAAWPDGVAPPADWERGRLSDVQINNYYKGAGVLGWGQEVGASALSLAAIASVAGSSHGRAPTPGVVLDPDPLLPAERGRALDQPPPVLLPDPAPVRVAMQGVLSNSGTADWLFDQVLGLQAGPVKGAAGGKTGTIEVGIPVDGAGVDRRDSLRRVRFYACGVLLPDELLGGSPEDRWDDPRFQADWAWFDEEMDSPATFGFASTGELCRSLVPGVPPAFGRDRGTEEAPGPIEQWEKLYRRKSSRKKSVKGKSSSFVATVFVPFLADGSPAPDGVPPSLADGRGLALAVIADNHPTAAKEAAAAILSDLHLYFQTRGDALPRAR